MVYETFNNIEVEIHKHGRSGFTGIH
jgi:hypothetical protein